MFDATGVRADGTRSDGIENRVGEKTDIFDEAIGGDLLGHAAPRMLVAGRPEAPGVFDHGVVDHRIQAEQSLVGDVKKAGEATQQKKLVQVPCMVDGRVRLVITEPRDARGA